MIDRERVQHVARLAALELADEEMAQIQLDLGKILDHVEQISELDLSEVEPSSQVITLTNVLRPDLPKPSTPREKMLSRAPDPVEEAYRVPSTQVDAHEG